MDLKNIPHMPGCYLFKDACGQIVYVGKAKDLHRRVSSYFRKAELDPKTQSMLRQAVSVDTFIVDSEKDAFLLESTLIKQHQPRYNINLRDSKRYAYIMATKEAFPRLAVARQKTDDGHYYGPFPSAEVRDTLLRFANKVFMLRTCRKLPKRPCLRFHMGLCTAPCKGLVSQADYALKAEDAKKLLSGRNRQLISDLKARMAVYAGRHEYEQAKSMRDAIAAIESLGERQLAETGQEHDQDVINYLIDAGIVHLAVFKARRGVLCGKSEYEFDYSEGFLEEFLLQYYSDEPVPNEIILPVKIPDGLTQFLSEKRGSRVYAIVPRKGERKGLIDLVKKNIESSFKEGELALLDLKEKIGLERPPRVMECFDISHLSGTSSVGSMARFVDGKPDKQGYRRFRIKTITGIDDYAMLGEVVRRRYTRLKEEKGPMPDLIIIDGGAGQLSAALSELKKLSLSIPALALAKKLEEVYLPDTPEPLRLDLRSQGMKLLQQARNEAHRFAVAYHKILRSKKVVGRN
ncbi:MAG: excinuclease ABC subunit UvrC [Candidatus Altiarchaeota archaeon]|nr:excinuclease ABC subunit UvrC [Candidatus Altiarchaeota archaeon]